MESSLYKVLKESNELADKGQVMIFTYKLTGQAFVIMPKEFAIRKNIIKDK